VSELTAEMMTDALVPRDLQMAPDGGAVLFVVAPVGQREEHPASAIWIAPSNGSAPARKLTAGVAEDRSPCWAIDGTAFFFLSDRAERGKAQLHRLPLDGGEAEKLTDWKSGIKEIAPLPDGERVAFLAVDPQTEEDERREKDRDDAQVFGEHWHPQRLRLRLLDLTTREVRTLDALGDRHVAELAPSPDGASIAVITWPTPEIDHIFRDAELQIVDLDSGAATLVCVLPAGGHNLSWDRQGERLYYLATRQPAGRGGNSLYEVETQIGEPKLLTEDLPACPTDIARGRESEPLVTVAEGLDTSVSRLEPATGTLSTLLHVQGNLNHLSPSADGRTIACTRSTADESADVWAGPVDGPLIRVSDLNPALREIAWGPQERLVWTAPDGLEIDGLLILPPGRSRADGPFPLITVVHGGPYGRFADALQLSWSPSGQWLAAAGYAVFLPNPRGGLGHGNDFADRVAGAVGKEDWGGSGSGLDRLLEQGVADPDRLGIGGWSQGGFMTAWAVGQTDRFRAAVMGAGVSDWAMMLAEGDLPSFEVLLGGSAAWDGPGPHRHAELSPISYAHRVKTPVLSLHGERDERVPVSQGRFFARALRHHNAPFELVVYPREPHGLKERNHQLDAIRRTRAWFDRWLREDAASADRADLEVAATTGRS
jgi:dipeptidyl aminopeptidase/acylaminoacyl peptidase